MYNTLEELYFWAKENGIDKFRLSILDEGGISLLTENRIDVYEELKELVIR